MNDLPPGSMWGMAHWPRMAIAELCEATAVGWLTVDRQLHDERDGLYIYPISPYAPIGAIESAAVELHDGQVIIRLPEYQTDPQNDDLHLTSLFRWREKTFDAGQEAGSWTLRLGPFQTLFVGYYADVNRMKAYVSSTLQARA